MMLRCILTMIPAITAFSCLFVGAVMELTGTRDALAMGMVLAIIAAIIFGAVMESD